MEQQGNLHRQEVFSVISPNPVKCGSCRFSHGKPPFADDPEKAYCQKYTRENGIQKPPGVLYDGKDCVYYEEV